MAENIPPRTEQVDLSRVILRYGPRDGWNNCRSQCHDSPSKTWAYVAPRKQYPLYQELLLSTAPVRQGLIDQSIIRPCQSPCNTLILPEKFNRENQVVQDLRPVREATKPIYQQSLLLTHCWPLYGPPGPGLLY